MIDNKSEPKTMVFRYSLWRKIYSIFLFIVVIIPPIFGCASENILFAGVLIAVFFLLLFDRYFKTIFSKIIIQKDSLIIKPGGLFWRWFKEEEAFPWKQFNFTVYYFNYKDEVHYSSIYISDNKKKQCLVLKSQAIESFSDMVKLLKNNNPNTMLLSLKGHIYRKGIRGIFMK